MLAARVREDVDFKAALRDDVLEIARNPAMVDQVSQEQYDAARE